MFSDDIGHIILRIYSEMERYGVLELPMFGISELLINLLALQNTSGTQTQIVKISIAYNSVNDKISALFIVEEKGNNPQRWKDLYKKLFKKFLKRMKNSFPLDPCYDKHLIIKCIGLFSFLYFFDGKEKSYENKKFLEALDKFSCYIFNGIEKLQITDVSPDTIFLGDIPDRLLKPLWLINKMGY